MLNYKQTAVTNQSADMSPSCPVTIGCTSNQPTAALSYQDSADIQ